MRETYLFKRTSYFTLSFIERKFAGPPKVKTGGIPTKREPWAGARSRKNVPFYGSKKISEEPRRAYEISKSAYEGSWRSQRCAKRALRRPKIALIQPTKAQEGSGLLQPRLPRKASREPVEASTQLQAHPQTDKINQDLENVLVVRVFQPASHVWVQAASRTPSVESF